MARIQNRIPRKVHAISDPGVAGRIRNRIPWLVEVVDAPADGEITNFTAVQVIEVAEYPDPIHNVAPIRVYNDPDSGAKDFKNAEPVAVYVVSGSLSGCAPPSGVLAGDRLTAEITFCDTVATVDKADWDWDLDGDESWTSMDAFGYIVGVGTPDNLVDITWPESVAAGTVRVRYTPGSMTVGGDAQDAVTITLSGG